MPQNPSDHFNVLQKKKKKQNKTKTKTLFSLGPLMTAREDLSDPPFSNFRDHKLQ
jgi:hypothetical protein